MSKIVDLCTFDVKCRKCWFTHFRVNFFGQKSASVKSLKNFMSVPQTTLPLPHPHPTCGWSGHSGQQRPNCGQCWGRPHFRSVSASSTFLSSHSPHPHHCYIVQGIWLNSMMSRMTNHCHCRQEIDGRDVWANKRQEDGGPQKGRNNVSRAYGAELIITEGVADNLDWTRDRAQNCLTKNNGASSGPHVCML